MPDAYLYVSNTTTVIRDEDESNYALLGKIESYHIPKLRIEPGKMIEPGKWEFVLKGDCRKALQYSTSGKTKAFRVVHENGYSCSTEGFYSRFPNPVEDDIFELTIQASGERVERG